MDDVFEGYHCRILAMDEDAEVREYIQDALHSYGCGYEVTTCGNQTQALHLLLCEKVEIDIVIAAINEACDVGLKFIDLIKRMTGLPVLAISSDWSEGLIHKAIRSGVFFILQKPLKDCELRWVFVDFPRWFLPRKKKEEKEEEEVRLAEEIEIKNLSVGSSPTNNDLEKDDLEKD